MQLKSVCFMKKNFLKITFQTFLCLFIRKLINRKHFSVKKKFGLVYKKMFFFYFEWNILSRSCEKIRNIILFVDYIKFDPQFFFCYIFYFEFFFPMSSIRIWFNSIFILTLILIFMIIICFTLIIFLLKFFIYQIWSSFFWLLFILFEIIYEIIIIIF